jgi:hypothetical protein
MMKKLFAAAIVVTMALAGSASANLVNYYSFNSATLNDEAPSYMENTGTGVSNLVMNDSQNLGTVYVQGIGSNYNPVNAPGDQAIWVKGGHDTSCEALALTGVPDVDLSAGGTHGWTLEFWVQAVNGSYGGNTADVFMNSTPGTGPNMNMGDYTSPSEPTITVNGRSATQDGTWYSTSHTIWHHIAIVAANDGSWQYYYDGVVHAANATTGTTSTISAIKWGIDALGGGGGSPRPNGANIYMDDLAMWDVPLSSSTVAAHAVPGGLGLTLGGSAHITPSPAPAAGTLNYGTVSVSTTSTTTISLLSDSGNGTAAHVNTVTFATGSMFGLDTAYATAPADIADGSSAVYGIKFLGSAAFGQTFTDTVTFNTNAGTFVYNLSATTATQHMGDANGDLKVDLQDFSLLKANYNQRQ